MNMAANTLSKVTERHSFRVVGSTPPTVQIISDNIRRYGNPLGIRKKQNRTWAKSLILPATGDYMLFTGSEYQMLDYLPSMMRYLKLVKFNPYISKIYNGAQSVADILGLSLTQFIPRSRKLSTTYTSILQKGVRVLMNLGVDFTYPEQADLYSGALLFEFGLINAFSHQANVVSDKFKKEKIKKLIALTPHSADVLKNVYPRYSVNINSEVVTFIQLIAELLPNYKRNLSLPTKEIVTIHDPCVLARSLGITQEPRVVLNMIKNIELREAPSNKERTVCCGAPCEVIYPEMSGILATRRLQELENTGAGIIITLCPYCHVNFTNAACLTKSKIRIIDFMEIVDLAMSGGIMK